MGDSFYIAVVLMLLSFFIAIGEIFKLKKEVRKLNKITKHLIEKKKK